MIIKYVKRVLIICLLIQLPFIQSAEFDFDGLDDFADAAAGMQHIPLNAIRLDPSESLSLIHDFNGESLIGKTFYIYTNPFRTRSYFDLETFQIFSQAGSDNLTFSPFFTQTSKAAFHKNKKYIHSYVDIDQKDIFEKLDEETFTDIQLPLFLSVVRNVKIQDRQIGCMLKRSTYVLDWNVNFLLPFLYQERNFFLTQQEIKILESLGLASDNFNFAQEHLISDKVGFGDLKIEFEKIIKHNYNYQLLLGFDVILPVAFPLLQGCIGTHFKKNKSNPNFNLQTDFLSLYQIGQPTNTQLMKNAEIIGLQALDRLSTLLLEKSLGNEGHIGLGFFVKNLIYLSSNIYFSAKTHLQILLPSTENRFFKINPNQNEIDVIKNLEDVDGLLDAQAQVYLDQLSRILVKNFFPSSYHTRVFPGVSIQSTNQLTFERINWNFHLGTDTWYRSKRKNRENMGK
ncbi:MAG: hypothetical protein LVQ75_02015 [Candidatus Babeliales bacterium]|jgi:hypothetical protein